MFDTIFGTDPEVFVIDENRNCIPPAALKEDFGMEFVDEKVIIDGGDWTIIEDGAATEINLAPSNESDVISDRIKRAGRRDRYQLSETGNSPVHQTVPGRIGADYQDRAGDERVLPSRDGGKDTDGS